MAELPPVPRQNPVLDQNGLATRPWAEWFEMVRVRIRGFTLSLSDAVTGVLPVANGGTNSSTALTNNRVMSSSGGAIVEASAITPARALVSGVSGIPTHSAVTSTELGYVSGVTSALQTQLAAKASAASLTTHAGTASAVHGVSGTIVGTTDTQTLTNKTLTSPILTTPTADTITAIAGGALSLVGDTNKNITATTSGSGVIDLNGVQFNLTNQIISTPSIDLEIRAKTGQNTKINAYTGVVKLQASSLDVASVGSTGITLATGKVLAQGTGTTTLNTTGAIVIPSATDTLVGKATTDTLTNKTIAAGSNTLSGITNSNLSGSAAIVNANLANVATATFKGRTTAGTGSPEDLTATQATGLLNGFVGDSGSGGTKGLVPAPASGDAAASKFLKADGTWAASGGLSNPMTTGGDLIYGGSSGAATRLANGSAGQVLRSSGSTTSPTWASPVVVLADTSTTSITSGADVTVVFSNKTSDTDSAYNSTTGVFTVPSGKGGFYSIAVFIEWGSFAASAGNTQRLGISVNSTVVKFLEDYVVPSTATKEWCLNGSTIVSVSAGDAVAVTAFQNSGSARLLGNSSQRQHLSIMKVGY